MEGVEASAEDGSHHTNLDNIYVELNNQPSELLQIVKYDLVPKKFHYHFSQFVVHLLTLSLFAVTMTVDYLVPHKCCMDYCDEIQFQQMLQHLPFSCQTKFYISRQK